MTSEAIVNQHGDYKYAWKASDAADIYIIAYGFINYGGDTKLVKRFKIVFNKDKYLAYIRHGKKYYTIMPARYDSFPRAQEALINHWIYMFKLPF